jgi:adenosylcobinamide-GDP ribazoletransferase
VSDRPGDAAASAAPGGNSRVAAHLVQIRLAASFLTILPLARAAPADSAEVAGSFGWFPLVGFAIGGVLCAADRWFGHFCAPAPRAVLTVALLATITGGLHLDGLADTADAIGAGRDRARALEIMRDSRIGSFGAITLILVIGLKIAVLAGSVGAPRYAALYMAPGLGRWAMVAIAQGLEYLRADGAGATLLARERRRNLWIATATAIVALIPVVARHALRACVIAVVITIALRSLYRRWLGGVTGDLIGAAGELVETAVLFAIAG